MIKSICILAAATLLLAINNPANGQQPLIPKHTVHESNKRAERVTISDPAEDNYDIKYLKFNLNLTNDTTYISGDVTTNATVVAPGFLTYVFELDSSLTIDKILINGFTVSFVTVGNVRTALLLFPLPVGFTFSAHVFYHGTPVIANTIFGGIGGINNAVIPYFNTRVTFTQSESYHALEWWPCKQSLRDKIDSMDMWITIPDSLKAGSNGTLEAITRMDATHVRYEWKERYPIDYYLISASVCRYDEYSYYMHFSGSTDSMLVQNYVYPGMMSFPYYKDILDSTGMMIDYFSTLYSRYPFWKEKYGHCIAPLGGGMEHQTMTTIGYLSSPIVAHELGHQWFGDNATCGSWGDIMMNEGFASYTEDLFIEHFNSRALAIGDMREKQDTVMDQNGGSIYYTDTSSEFRIFDTRLSYDKGACFLHMLRFVINNDSEFFTVYQSYQQEKKNNTGTIADFKTSAISIFGKSVNGIYLDSFFDQWAYKQGFPKYTVSWNQKDNDVYVKLVQTTSMPSSVPFFTLPMEIKLHSAAGDTTVRVFNDQPSQVFHFTWGKSMAGMVTDPNYWLVYKLNGAIKHDTTLSLVGIPELAAQTISIVPNPSSTYWTANNLPVNSSLALTDLSGRILWKGNNLQNSSIQIPAEKLPTGLYILRAILNGSEVINYKLIKE